MSENGAIEWTDATWNPVTGCTKISAGCDNCYAARLSERFRGVPGHPFETGFDLTLRPDRLLQPFAWKRPRMIFVNSMSDLFHKEIPPAYISAVFETMERAHWHTYQVLTKRSSLMRRFLNERYNSRPAPANVWIGVSVENRQATSRITHLQKTRASVRFLSLEPQEAFALLAAASALDPEFGLLCIALLYTGMRISEALGAKVRHLHLDRAALDLPETKNGEGRTVFLPPVVVKAFRAMLASRSQEACEGCSLHTGEVVGSIPTAPTS